MPDLNHPAYIEIKALKEQWRKGEITNEEFTLQSDLISKKYFPNGVSEDEQEQLQKAKEMFGGQII